MPKNDTATPPGYTTVTIYDQAYHLTGQNPAHIHRLAELFGSKMRAVTAQGRSVDSLRVAVLAALNLADELLRAGGGQIHEGHSRALTLRGLLDEVLEEERKTG